MKTICPECGTHGNLNLHGRFTSDDWVRSAELQQRNDKLEQVLKAARRQRDLIFNGPHPELITQELCDAIKKCAAPATD